VASRQKPRRRPCRQTSTALITRGTCVGPSCSPSGASLTTQWLAYVERCIVPCHNCDCIIAGAGICSKGPYTWPRCRTHSREAATQTQTPASWVAWLGLCTGLTLYQQTCVRQFWAATLAVQAMRARSSCSQQTCSTGSDACLRHEVSSINNSCFFRGLPVRGSALAAKPGCISARGNGNATEGSRPS